MATLERVAALELLVLALKRSLVSVANRTAALKKLTGYLDGDHRRALLGIHQRVVNLACAPKVHRKVLVRVQSAADIHAKPWWKRQTMVEAAAVVATETSLRKAACLWLDWPEAARPTKSQLARSASAWSGCVSAQTH